MWVRRGIAPSRYGYYTPQRVYKNGVLRLFHAVTEEVHVLLPEVTGDLDHGKYVPRFNSVVVTVPCRMRNNGWGRSF